MKHIEKYKKQTKNLKKENSDVYKKLNNLLSNVEKTIQEKPNHNVKVNTSTTSAAGAPLPIRDNSINSWVNSLRSDIYR
jgi:hypothetical protein